MGIPAALVDALRAYRITKFEVLDVVVRKGKGDFIVVPSSSVLCPPNPCATVSKCVCKPRRISRSHAKIIQHQVHPNQSHSQNS